MEELIFDPSKLKKKKKTIEMSIVQSDELTSNRFDLNLEGSNLTKINEEIKTKEREYPNLYTYDEMLNLLYSKMTVKTNDKFPLPIVESTKAVVPTTFIRNFSIICKTLNRDSLHVQDYLKLESSIEKMNINSKGELWFVGRLTTKEVMTMFQNYIREYVKCKICGSHKTNFLKKQGILFVHCAECKGEKSVPILKR